MPDALTWGLVAALLLFWAVGAYNRLVRLRAQALQAFGGLAMQLQRRIALAQAFGAPEAEAGSDAPAWSGLQAAAAQCAASLSAAKARPLDRASLAALAAAEGVLTQAWQRVVSALPERRGARMPDRQRSEWEQVALQLTAATDEFNLAVGTYNHAVRQFPAGLLAWLFGFRSARPFARH